MKELSIEQKAQRYDKALERARDVYTYYCDDREQLRKIESIFPELKESEGEKTKKEILDYIIKGSESYYDVQQYGKERFKKWIAWLERQGEQKPAEWHREDEQNLNVCLGYIPDEFLRKWLIDIIHVKYDKPADKVEPKFKVGDWITDGNSALHITSMDSGFYQFEDSYDVKAIIDKKYHLWTIQDAKDGDVLIDKSGSREGPFIFKETKPSDIKTDMLNPLTVLGYCGIGGAGFSKGSGWGDTANCIYYPATKEQRALLFQKMKEAEYEWDVKKKALKKITQNLTWSEEDEEIVEALNDYTKNLDIFFSEIKISDKDILSKEFREKVQHWLKSLKDRVGCEVNCTTTWKPSESDIRILEQVIDGTSNPINYQATLHAILEKLKKIKEE